MSPAARNGASEVRGRQDGIADHAAIGDGRSVALVSRSGHVDWLCWPRFDSPSLFAAILDPRRGGSFLVAPAGGALAQSRRYLDGTNILASTFSTASGVLRLLDFMPVGDEEEQHRGLAPEHELLRLATCEQGELDVDIAVDLRPEYGAIHRSPRDAGVLGIRVEHRQQLLTVRATVPLSIRPDGVIRGRARLRAGDEVQVSLTYDEEAPAALPPLGGRAHDALRRTAATWRDWARAIPQDLPCHGVVERSALALKLLAYAPSGAIVAAPTTSLPEREGGDLNWDYRFCWLRDAALTVRALYGLGLRNDAVRFASWLLHATRLTRPRVRVLYDVFGNSPRAERELGHLGGHRGSRPVRVGNAAATQVQLDAYGEVIDAVAQIAQEGAALDRETQAMLRDFGTFVCEHWQEPDSGIWEPREPPTHRTHSLVLAWAALDRLVALHRSGAIARLPLDRFERNRALIRERVERDGWNARLGSYVATLGGDEVDSALLLLPWYRYAPPDDPRVRATWLRIRQRLQAGPGLLYRYERSVREREGAFGICSFWAAEHLARGGGSLAEARAWFASALAYGNDVGLFAEEIDPQSGAALGNFPQAFTHVGIVNAALAIRERAAREHVGAAAGERGGRDAASRGAVRLAGDGGEEALP